MGWSLCPKRRALQKVNGLVENQNKLYFLHLIVYSGVFYVIGVDREIECAGATESTDVLYVSVRVTCTVKLNIEENFKIWMVSFLLESRHYLTENDHFSDKEKIYFKLGAIDADGNTSGEYLLKKLRLRRGE